MADMITQYLASRGAALSAENASRVRQHFASNPDLLDRRAMGLPGGLDDNSSVLDAMLDKHIAESMPQIPQGSVEVGPVTKAPAPSRTDPAVKKSGEVGGTVPVQTGKPGASRQLNYGPGASPNRQANYDAPAGSTMDENLVAGTDVMNNAGSGLSNWLIGLLGGAGALYGLNKMGGRGAQTAAPAGPLPGTVPPGGIPMDSVPPGAGPNASPAPYGTDLRTPATNNPVAGSTVVPEGGAAQNDLNKQRIQAEVDAENDAMMRKMAEEERVRRAQAGTQETLDAARGRQREFGQTAKRAIRGR